MTMDQDHDTTAGTPDGPTGTDDAGTAPGDGWASAPPPAQDATWQSSPPPPAWTGDAPAGAPTGPTGQITVDEAIAAARLDDAVYARVGPDESRTVEAVALVAAVYAIAGLATLLFGDQGIGGWIASVLFGTAIAYPAWVLIVWLTGKFFGGQAGYLELARGIGFASGPWALSIVPVIGSIVGGIWSIVCQIRAVSVINRVSQGQAMATVLIPLAVFVLLGAAVALLGLVAFATAMSGAAG